MMPSPDNVYRVVDRPPIVTQSEEGDRQWAVLYRDENGQQVVIELSEEMARMTHAELEKAFTD